METHEKPIYREELLKTGWGGGGLGQFTDLRGGVGKKERVVFLKGGDTLMHTMKLDTLIP